MYNKAFQFELILILQKSCNNKSSHVSPLQINNLKIFPHILFQHPLSPIYTPIYCIFESRCIFISFYPLIFYTKNTEVLLHNHSIVMKFRKFIIDTSLICSIYSNLSIVLMVFIAKILFSIQDPVQNHTFHLVVMSFQSSLICYGSLAFIFLF